MLVLSRKKNDVVCINDDIRITVLEIRGDKVRLGIVAPKSIPVHREEVYLTIEQEKIQARLAIEAKRDKEKEDAQLRLREIVKEIEAEKMQCNCDLDNWTPEISTGHSWVCRIHKAAIRRSRNVSAA